MLRILKKMKRRGSWANTRCCVLKYYLNGFGETFIFSRDIFHRQGSFLVYPIDEDDIDETKCEITKGIPINSAIKVLARVYIIKVSNLYSVFQNGQIHNGLSKGFNSKRLFQCISTCSRMELR